MKIKFLIVSLTLCPAIWPQSASTQAPTPEKIIRVVHVHGDAGILANLSGSGSGAVVLGNNQLGAVVIKGTSSDVNSVVRTIQDLDTAGPADSSGKNIELVIYVVGGSMEPIPGISDAGSEKLEPVYKQLRAVFPYKNYQLLNTMLMRSGQNSEAGTSGMMRALQASPDFDRPGSYAIHYGSATVSGDTSSSIHFARFKFEAQIPYITGSLNQKGKDGSGSYASTQFQQARIEIETNVDLREGQKVVIGTSNVEMANATLFLIVTARVVQ